MSVEKSKNVEKSKTLEDKIKSIIYDLSHVNINLNLEDIFKCPQMFNIIMLNNEIFKLFLNYLTVIHKKEIIFDLIDYIHKKKDDETNMILNRFLFYEGCYALVDVKKINDNKMINEMLIFNNQPTTDEHFNEVFNEIKNYILVSYSYNDEIYENAKNNEFDFKFLKQFYNKPNLMLSIKNSSKLSENLIYDPVFGESFILPYNYDNEIFKKSFYALCSYQYDLSFENCLKVFLNYEKLFYSKIVTINSQDSNLVTYIYFNNNDGYIPNLRYTIDLPKMPPDDLIKIKHNDYPGFKTSIEKDDKGIYFKTINYDYNEIKNYCDKLIKNENYEELIYYIFNSQFLSRSTCLFGYYIYFKFTKKIPDTIKYYDIIALTHPFEQTKKEIKDGFKYYDFKIKVNNLTLQKIIDFVHK